MDLKNLTLSKGQALVLVGHQGCGKSTIARHIAARHGSFVEVDCDQLTAKRELNRILDGQPDTVIADEMPRTVEDLEKIKALLTSNVLCIKPPYGPARQVKAPNFIFCTNDWDFLPGNPESRRFFVVRMGDAK